MSARIPKFSEMAAVAKERGRNSDAPDLWENVRGLWSMAEGGGPTVYDLSGYGNHGTLTNMDPATDWVVTEKGRALQFDNVNDVVDLGSNLALASGQPFSLAAWVYITVLVFRNGIFSIGSAVGGQGPHLSMQSSGWRFGLWGSGSADSVASVILNRWQLLCGVYHGGNAASLFVDGQLVDTESSFAFTGTDGTGRLGALNNGGSPYGGQLGDAGMWDRALSPAEIQQLHADPDAMIRLRRKVYPAVVATSIPYWIFSRSSQVIGGGVA